MRHNQVACKLLAVGFVSTVVLDLNMEVKAALATVHFRTILVRANKTALDLLCGSAHVLFSYLHLSCLSDFIIRKFRITLIIFEWGNKGPSGMRIGGGLLLSNTEVLGLRSFSLQ